MSELQELLEGFEDAIVTREYLISSDHRELRVLDKADTDVETAKLKLVNWIESKLCAC